MKIIFCAVVISIFSGTANAVELCEDLFANACAQDGAGHKDPSGKVLSGAELKEKVETARAKLQVRLLELSRKALTTDPSLAKKLKTLLKCKGECEAVSAQALQAVMDRDATYGEGRFEYQNLKLMDIYSIITHPSYSALQLQAQAEYREMLAPKAKRDEIEGNLYRNVRELVIARVEKMQMDEKTRSAIIKRLEKINFRAGDCGQVRGWEHYPDSLLFSGQADELRICDATLAKVDSVIATAAMIVHDLGHPFDPCQIGRGRNRIIDYVINNPLRSRDAQYPLPDLLRCLRDTKSVFAKPAQEGEDCSKDQINEAFGDWLTAEVLPEFIAKYYPAATLEEKRAAYLNSVWGTCSNKTSAGYPLGVVRANAVLAMNPKVREMLGCPQAHAKYTYCAAPAAGEVPATTAPAVVK